MSKDVADSLPTKLSSPGGGAAEVASAAAESAWTEYISGELPASDWIVPTTSMDWNFARMMREWWTRGRVSQVAERRAVEILAADVEEDDPVQARSDWRAELEARLPSDGPPEERPMTGNRYRAAWYFAKQVKAEHPGITVDTVANRLAAQHAVVKLMKESNLRKKHIASNWRIAVALVFVPDREDLAVREFEASHAVQERVREGTQVLHTRDRPWMFNWLGRKRLRPEPARA